MGRRIIGAGKRGSGGRKFRRGLGVFLLLSCEMLLNAEQISMTTWYPAPVGVYQSLVTTGGAPSSPVNTILNRDAGSVGVGVAAPAAKMQVAGDIAAQALAGHPAAVPGYADIHAKGNDVFYTDQSGYVHRISRPRIYTWLVPFQGQAWPPQLCSSPGLGGPGSDTAGPAGGGYGFLVGCMGIGWWNNWQNDCHFSGYDTSVGWNYSPTNPNGQFPWNPSATAQWGDTLWCGAGGYDGNPAPTCKAICMNIEFDFNL